MSIIRFAALDGAKSNFGIAKMLFDTSNMTLDVENLTLIKTAKNSAKTIRKSSDNLRRAQEIAESIRLHLSDCVMAFGEVPSGGQSAEAVHAFGIVIGLYASITIPFVEVTPSETKLAAVGTKTASKQEMIEWAVGKFPNANWKTVKRNGILTPTLDNEHLADAVAIAHAGIRTNMFKQVVAISSASQSKVA